MHLPLTVLRTHTDINDLAIGTADSVEFVRKVNVSDAGPSPSATPLVTNSCGLEGRSLRSG